MTTVALLLFGAGYVLILSVFERDSQGNDISVWQTIQDVWTDNLQGPYFHRDTATNNNQQPNKPTPPGLGNSRLPLASIPAVNQIQQTSL